MIDVKLSVYKQWNNMKILASFKNKNEFIKYLLNNIPRSRFPKSLISEKQEEPVEEVSVVNSTIEQVEEVRISDSLEVDLGLLQYQRWSAL